jgi:hypothetical protein
MSFDAPPGKRITAPMSWASHHIWRATHGFIRADIGGDSSNPDLRIAWKYLYTSKDTWLGPKQDLGAIGSIYCLTMDPYEKYDMTFNGAVSTRLPTTSPGRYAGYDNGWVASLISMPQMEFDKSIVDFPNIKRPGSRTVLSTRHSCFVETVLFASVGDGPRF